MAAKKNAPAKKRAARSPKKLSARQREDIYVLEMAKHGNGARAARAAGFSEAGARYQSRDYLQREDIRNRITEAHRTAVEVAGSDVAKIMRDLDDIANADSNDLIQLHRVCCRFCHGYEFRQQFTLNEERARRETHRQEVEKARRILAKADEVSLDAIAEDDPRLPLFETSGGQYDGTKDPNPRCPECWGQGTERVVIQDTRDINPRSRRLLAGVKMTNTGLEVKMHDQMAARQMLGRASGMFKDSVKVSGTGPNGEVVHQHAAVAELFALAAGADTGPARAD